MISQNGWATSAEISVAACLLKCQINIWYEVGNRYSIQSFNPDGQPINVSDIRLKNSHFQLLKPFCHVQSSTDIGPSSTCHQFYSGETAFEEALKRQKAACYSNICYAFNGNINSKNDIDNDLDNDIQVKEPDKSPTSQADCRLTKHLEISKATQLLQYYTDFSPGRQDM